MEYCDVTMKTQTNLYRNIGVHTKPLDGVSIRKHVSCWSFYNTEAGKCTTCTLMNFHIFRSHFHFQFTFRTCTAHQAKIKPIDDCIRTSNLSGLMHAHIIKYCFVYFCVAFSRVLRIMTQNESCDIVTSALCCRTSRQ